MSVLVNGCVCITTCAVDCGAFLMLTSACAARLCVCVCCRVCSPTACKSTARCERRRRSGRTMSEFNELYVYLLCLSHCFLCSMQLHLLLMLIPRRAEHAALKDEMELMRRYQSRMTQDLLTVSREVRSLVLSLLYFSPVSVSVRTFVSMLVFVTPRAMLTARVRAG